MPRDSNGVYTLPPGYQAINGEIILPSQHNPPLEDIAQALTNSLPRNGSAPMTGELKMGNNKITGLANGTNATDAATVGQIPAGGLYNKIINGNFVVNQRAVSGTVTLAANAFGHDRWKAGASGCTYTFTTNGIDTVINILSGSLMQIVEDLNVEGGVYSLAWTGTATGRVAINGAATTGAYAASPIVTGSANSRQTIRVEFTLGTLSNVQLKFGSDVAIFERRPYGLELELCQRYYEAGFLRATGYVANNSGDWVTALVRYNTPKRQGPSVSMSYVAGNVSGFIVRGGDIGGFAYGFTMSGAAPDLCTAVYNWQSTAEL